MNRFIRIAAIAALLVIATTRSVSAQPVRATVASNEPTKKVVTAPGQITIQREVFSYEGRGRRDPYLSLMSSKEIRPLISDLRVTAIAFDPDGQNSVAILRDTFLKTQYRARVGQQLGRMRVSAITEKQVLFTIEEYGFNRTERLKVTSDSTTARNP